MPNVEYLKATENDFEELIDFINLVFSSNFPHNFERMLPALYLKRNFMAGTNYIVKENGKIVANVGAYPVYYNVCGDILKISAITCVAVHARNRSKGYMKDCMHAALQDMRKDGVDLSFLYGLRQRYEYFGYTQCGVRFEYHCNDHNISHTFGKELKKDITLKEADGNDTEIFNDIYDMYHTGNAYVIRPEERFPDIMSTWENKTIGIYKNDRFIGYMAVEKNYSSICELKIPDPDLIGEVLNAYLEKYKRNDISVTVFPFETEKDLAISKFADAVSIHSDGSYYVIDYPDVIRSFLKLTLENTGISDGAFPLLIRDIGNITVSVSNNIPAVEFTDEKPDAELTALEASRLLFSHSSAFSLGALAGNTFARCLLPIPLFIRRLDRS